MSRIARVLVAVAALVVLFHGRAAAQNRVITYPAIFEPGFVSDPIGAIKAARQRIAAGDMEGAVKHLEIYVAGHPREVGPARFLGDLYYRQGHFDKAEAVYLALIAVNPNDKETHNRLGVVYATENRVDDAIAQFNSALPGTDSVADLVALHLRKGDLPAYRSQMEKEAASDPTDADIQAEVGQIYAALHAPGDAVVYFMRALDSDPNSLTALNGLGLAYLDLHAYGESEKDFIHCLRLDPENYTCENNLGATYLQMQRYADAQPVLSKAHALAPERPESLVNFGFLADVRGDWKRAISYYVQATTVGPYLPEAYVDLGVDYEHNGLYALAESALLKGISAAPQDGRIRYLLAVAYAAQGQMQLAMDQLKVAEKSIDPDVARIAQQESVKLTGATAPTPQR
jgi:tetratricopeptide (TPR) repeat protein